MRRLSSDNITCPFSKRKDAVGLAGESRIAAAAINNNACIESLQAESIDDVKSQAEPCESPSGQRPFVPEAPADIGG